MFCTDVECNISCLRTIPTSYLFLINEISWQIAFAARSMDLCQQPRRQSKNSCGANDGMEDMKTNRLWFHWRNHASSSSQRFRMCFSVICSQPYSPCRVVTDEYWFVSSVYYRRDPNGNPIEFFSEVHSTPCGRKPRHVGSSYAADSTAVLGCTWMNDIGTHLHYL